MGSLFCDRLRLNFEAFAWRGIYMPVERDVVLVKKVTYFEEFGYLNSFCIIKSITLMFLSSSRDKFTPAGAHQDGHQHGVPIQISMYLGTVFLRICYEKLLVWPEPWKESLPYFFSHILDFIYWTVLIFILIYFDLFWLFFIISKIVLLLLYSMWSVLNLKEFKRWKVFSIFDICVVHLVTGTEEDC